MHNAQIAALSLCSILLIYRIAKNLVTKNFVIWSTLTAAFATEKFHLTKLRTKFVTKPAHAGKMRLSETKLVQTEGSTMLA